ncbi:MAG: glycosyltransferase family 2 protein [Gammaproteobacteria bacterium]|nr:glycosyltransferase family 2 protein [Gammaproteobacteria bacterium]
MKELWEPYTVALTSCARFDLLERTLRSLLPLLDGPCQGVLIGEDSADRGVFDVISKVSGMGVPIEVIFNRRRLGICGNIDRIYSEVPTEWVFHCEDDWMFVRGGFISESFEILKANHTVSSVNLRAVSDLPSEYWRLTQDGYYLANSGADYAGLHFNPGLRRMSDYHRIGPYRKLAVAAGEFDASRAYLAHGMQMASLLRPAVEHIGWGCHVPNRAKRHGFRLQLMWRIAKRIRRLNRRFPRKF